MDNKNAFLGRGWAFPPEFSNTIRETKMTFGEEDIQGSLHILLTTKLGERVMLPQYGCNLEDLMFENLDRTLKTYAIDQIKTAILYHEPRIDVLKVDLTESDPLEGKLHLIHIEYIIRATNARTNVVFPFYEEGTDI